MEIIIFYLLTISFAFISTLTLKILGLDLTTPVGQIFLGFLYMPSPLFSTIITSIIFKKKINWGVIFDFKAILKAVCIFCITILIQLVFIAILNLFKIYSFGDLVTSQTEFTYRINSIYSALITEGIPLNLPPVILMYPLLLISSILAGTSINAIFAYTEEIGWRGFLFDRLKSFKWWQRSLITGLLWGVWHSPLIILFGYNYPNNRDIGAILFIFVCIGLSFILDKIRINTKSLLPAAIFHGSFNGSGALLMLLASGTNILLGPALGLLGIFCYFIIGILLPNKLKSESQLIDTGAPPFPLSHPKIKNL